MKKATKTLLLMLCAVVLVVSSILGTVAYLTSTDTVTNTFTVGKVEITMDEAKVDEYGVATTPAERVIENTYKLIPGHTYTKDPTIYVAAGSEECWLFAKIENNLSADAATPDINTTNWIPVAAGSNVYAYKETVDAREAENDIPVVVFENFTVADEIENAAVTANDGKTIVVTAYAVQADGFVEDTTNNKSAAVVAWEATFGAPQMP